MASQSGRTLGRGRVIGPPPPQQPASSSTTLSPAAAAGRPTPNHTLLSPSASSVSLNSQQSTSKSSNDDTDISSAVALPGQAAVVAPPAKMVCPICGDEMLTLLQLNRHLDDAHKNLGEEEEDEVKTWFKTQMVKAKKFQPLAVLNQKFKGLDVFESNMDVRPSPPPSAASHTSVDHTSHHPVSSPRPAPTPTPTVIDPEDIITKEHWQRYTHDGTCSDPLCPKRLGPTSGNINCRHCGRLFCEEHTMYQMKLSRSANWEPVRGYWYRVCETCFKSRDGYNDHKGVTRDHTDAFAAVRRKAVDKAYLDVSRLEKRLTKLTQVLTDPRIDEDQGTVAYLRKVSGAKSQQRILEESVVDWEDDTLVDACPFCQQQFTTYTFRRHHCRLCGRVVCADTATGCSSVVGLDADARHATGGEKGDGPTSVELRMCKDCKGTVFGKSDFARELARATPDQRTFENLKQFEKGISMMLPRFQRLLTALQDPDKPPSAAQLGEATKVRRRLTDSFTQYDVAARRIRDLPTDSPAQRRLQRQVHMQASQFLHVHMLPLKALPKMLRHASPHGRSGSASSIGTSTASTAVGKQLSPASSPAPRHRSPLAAIQKLQAPGDEGGSQPSSASRLSSLETEERAAREQLIVLEEQKIMVGEMLADARRRRKFEEVESLARNLEDLGRECDRLQRVLEGLRRDVEGVYTGISVPVPPVSGVF